MQTACQTGGLWNEEAYELLDLSAYGSRRLLVCIRLLGTSRKIVGTNFVFSAVEYIFLKGVGRACRLTAIAGTTIQTKLYG